MQDGIHLAAVCLVGGVRYSCGRMRVLTLNLGIEYINTANEFPKAIWHRHKSVK